MDLRPDEHDEIRRVVFWTLAEFCAEFRLPFDLMIGPIRNVYPAGVAGGRDLFDRRVSLHDYRELFNHFAGVTFPVSTLSPDAGAELVAYAWIFPNVVPHGPLVVLEHPGVHRRRPAGAAPGGAQDRSWSATTPTPTSSNSSCPSSTCSAGSWPRPWPRTRSAGGAGRSSAALELARLVLLENPRRIFGRDRRFESPLRRFDRGGIAGNDSRSRRTWLDRSSPTGWPDFPDRGPSSLRAC